MDPVYLDHAATTPLAPGVFDAMRPWLGERFGNASSVHGRGREARHAVESARTTIAAALGVEPPQVWFTSGGTEADNTAVLGLAAARDGTIVTSATEHEAVLQPVRRLARTGRTVVELPPDARGTVTAEAVGQAIAGGAAFVSVMTANNELGTLSPVRAISAACRAQGVPFHTDAVQAAAWTDVSPDALGADLVTVSAHKLGGPVGVGALLVRYGVECEPLLVGGGQERNRRAGTENVAAIVGFAEAVRSLSEERRMESRRIRALRDRLADGLVAALGELVSVTTPVQNAVPHILHCTFPEIDGRMPDGEMLLLGLDLEGVQASAGSACASGTVEPSHVLTAMGLDRRRAGAALRFSLGHSTTEEDIDRALPAIVRTVRRVRG